MLELYIYFRSGRELHYSLLEPRVVKLITAWRSWVKDFGSKEQWYEDLDDLDPALNIYLDLDQIEGIDTQPEEKTE